MVRLADVAKIIMGQSPDGNSITKNSNGTEFHQGKIFFTERHLAHSGQFTITGNKIVEPNSALLCVRAPVGTVNITEREIAIGRGLCALTPMGGMNVIFLFYWLTAFKDDFIAQATGSTFTAITTDVVKQQLVPIPPLAEQYRIVEIIEQCLQRLMSIAENLC
jgi:type I restriction enzyme S subunit